MCSSWITPQEISDNRRLMPANPSKDTASRLSLFIAWLDVNGLTWHDPDLSAYRDYLLVSGKRRGSGGLSPETVKAHLATIRGRYKQLLTDNTVRQSLYDLTPAGASAADRKAFVDELLTRMQNAIHPTTAPVESVTVQDQADSAYLRLKPHQVKALLQAPGIDTLVGLRDTALIALLVCTGIREAELVALNMNDLRQELGGELALRVRLGKGRKQRLVPYGALDWCLVYVERWLVSAGIANGAVFRGFYRGGRRVRARRLTTRAVNDILNSYPITVNGGVLAVKPHDLRRTYARNAYEQGMDILRIQQNLGHASMDTTLSYIGALNAEQRRPPAMFESPYDLADLETKWVI